MVLTLGTAKNSHIPKLKELWKLCFGDNDSYIELFFNNRYKEDQCFVVLDGDLPVAMLFTLPVDICLKQYRYKAMYIYAVATHPQHQGKGYSTKLLDYTHDRLKLMGYSASVLVPGEYSLFEYYQKRGFVCNFFVSYVGFSKNDAPLNSNITVQETSFSKIEVLRNELLVRYDCFVAWDRESFVYHQKELDYTDGKVLYLSSDSNSGYAVCHHKKNTVNVKEFICSGTPDEFAGAIMKFFDCDTITFRLPPNDNSISFGMIKCYEDIPSFEGEKSYLGLVLD